MDYLPVFLDVRERPVVVVGGGVVAARKVELLAAAGARILVVAPTLGPELRERLIGMDPGRLRHLAVRFEPNQLDGAALVIAATDDDEVNRAVAQAAGERSLPINVVDDARRSSFLVPAIVDRSPVVVAIGTGGTSPVLARELRTWIEALLPARLGDLARMLGARRREVRRSLRPSLRRRFWERLLGGAFRTEVIAGKPLAAARIFARELAAAQSGSAESQGEVYLIGAGPGDPDLLTLRAVQLLQQADVVLYDRLIPPAVLERVRRDARRIFVGKEPGTPAISQEEIAALMIRFARAGLRVARLKGGDPFIFGRGGEELEALAAAGIPCTVVPGITAALGAAASIGLPLTHRAHAHTLTLVSGSPADGAEPDWVALARPQQTIVFYMGVARLGHIVAQLRAAGALGTRPAALIERATQAGERLIEGTLADIERRAAEGDIRAPALLVVGETAALARTRVDSCVAFAASPGPRAAA